MAVPLMNSGGIILSDNVLWSGKVLEPISDKDTSNVLVEYNQCKHRRTCWWFCYLFATVDRDLSKNKFRKGKFAGY
jgi:hypothetical protein